MNEELLELIRELKKIEGCLLLMKRLQSKQ
jgi:hypothetical protein